jgi:hypothetical protein
VNAECTFTVRGSGLTTDSRVYLTGQNNWCGQNNGGAEQCGSGWKIFGEGVACESAVPTDNGDGSLTFTFGTVQAGTPGMNVRVCWGESTAKGELRVLIDEDPYDADDKKGRICGDGITYENCWPTR